MKFFNIKTISIIFLAIFLCFANFFEITTSKPPIEISKEESAINIKSNILMIFNFGLKRLISSFLWVQTIIESDIEHYKKKDGNSWIYHRIISIITLDPEFLTAYKWGGQYLSVIKDDVWGAKNIYEKGLKQFPDDFWLSFYAGFNYYWELGDCKSAYKIFDKIKFHPKAKKFIPYLPMLTARAKACDGNLTDAFLIIYQSYQDAHPDSMLKKRLYKNAYSIRAEIDLTCLNSSKNNKCRKFDLNNHPYILIDRKYKAQQSWKKYRLKTRKNFMKK